jgi:antitoxin MazE
MQASVQRWGKSLVLRIPKTFAAELGLESDAQAEITLLEGKLIVAPTQAPEYDLEELLAGVTDENIHAEINSGPPIGKEIW